MFDEVSWERLKPEEFGGRLADKPVIDLPLGLCEPLGPIAPSPRKDGGSATIDEVRD